MPKITELWAYITEDTGPDDEGVVASLGGHGGIGIMPLIGADAERMLSLKGLERATAKASGKTVKLVKFTTRTEVETL